METTTTTAAGQATYYVTTHGSHRHENMGCANVRRASASQVRIATQDHKDLPRCQHCCDATDVAAARASTPAPEYCPNPGVEMTHRISSECKACGKLGKVVRGKLRAHKPA